MPAETVARIRALDALHVRGNADREIADGSRDDAVTQWAMEHLGESGRAWLSGLPEEQVVEVEGLGRVRFVHGSPRSDEETITAVTPEARVAEMLEGVEEPLVVCGHTHAAFDRRVGGTRIVNAGSVGLPFGQPGAHWLLLGRGIVEHVVTPYDFEAAGAHFRALGAPDADEFADHIEAPPPASTAAELYG